MFIVSGRFLQFIGVAIVAVDTITSSWVLMFVGRFLFGVSAASMMVLKNKLYFEFLTAYGPWLFSFAIAAAIAVGRVGSGIASLTLTPISMAYGVDTSFYLAFMFTVSDMLWTMTAVWYEGILMAVVERRPEEQGVKEEEAAQILEGDTKRQREMVKGGAPAAPEEQTVSGGGDGSSGAGGDPPDGGGSTSTEPTAAPAVLPRRTSGGAGSGESGDDDIPEIASSSTTGSRSTGANYTSPGSHDEDGGGPSPAEAERAQKSFFKRFVSDIFEFDRIFWLLVALCMWIVSAGRAWMNLAQALLAGLFLDFDFSDAAAVDTSNVIAVFHFVFAVGLLLYGYVVDWFGYRALQLLVAAILTVVLHSLMLMTVDLFWGVPDKMTRKVGQDERAST